MSRIYEALQKAEAERGPDREAESRDGQRPVYSGVGASVSSAAEAGDARRPGFRERYQTVLLDEPTIATSAISEAEPQGEVDLNSLPLQAWAPAFDRLPSLLDRGPGVEQFRSLRSRLYELRDKRPLKTVLVTSGLPQEGKSFVSSNLAISLARNKHARVLLIDGDMRRYTVHKTLGCRLEPGLADFLAGRARLTDVLQRVDPVHSTGMVQGTVVTLPALTVISGGNGGDDAADLSNNYRWAELLQALKPLFEWIVVDSSPVLPVSDTVNLSRNCDGVLLVSRSGVTEYANLQRTQAELKSAPLLGVVLNGAAPQTGKVGYYGYNSYAAYASSEQTSARPEQSR